MKGFGHENNLRNNKIKLSQKRNIEQGIKLHMQGKIHEASNQYKLCISKGILDVRVFSNYGAILLDSGEFKEAEKYTLKAIKLNPNFANAHSNLGTILRNLGRLEESELSLRKAIYLNPDFVNAHANLGNILRDLGRLEEAELSLRKAIKLNPDLANLNANLGSILRDLGKLEEAERYTLKAIELNPSLSIANFNLGGILRDLGKLEGSERYTRKAIELNPSFAMAHSNLGSILRDLGKLEEAERYTRKAIELNPSFAIAHSNLGSILRDLGKLEEAESYIRKAIKINPSLEIAHSNLGTILYDSGKSIEALDHYLKVIQINPYQSNIYPSITELLRTENLSRFEKSKLKFILNLFLEKNNISHQDLFNTFNILYKNVLKANLTNSESKFPKMEFLENNKIIIKAFKKIIFRDTELEKILSKVRRDMCKKVFDNIQIITELEYYFIIALGEQCFLNEYIYSSTYEEREYIERIIAESKNNKICEKKVAMLSCYIPLYKLIDQLPDLKSFQSSEKYLEELIKLQIIEPLQEIELSKSIRTVGDINNNISLKVKLQYEQNPYPRWRYINHIENKKIFINQAVNNDIIPNFISSNEIKSKLKVLIAGCGTGSQIFQAQRYANAEITAIDLSLASLSYAKRKLNEFQLQNVELIQIDILDVHLLEEKFDVIECVGVLHHMEEPEKGLKVLLEILKDDGFLKLGLYSEIARKNIIQTRDYIKNSKIDKTEIEICNFREKVISGELNKLVSLKFFDDFYSYSQFRDLCFHEKEHLYNINKLKQILKSNKLKFMGFLLSQKIKKLYSFDFQDDKQNTNLNNWKIFEENNPNTFKSMYQFWVCRI